MYRVTGTWRDRLRAAPLWALFLYFAVAFGFLSSIFPGGTGPRSLADGIFRGVFFAVPMTAISAVARRRDDATSGRHSQTQQTVMARSLRTGELPADPSLWSPLLALIERRRNQLAWSDRYGPWVFGSMIVLSLLLAIADPLYLIYGIFFVGMLVGTRRASTKSRERLTQLDWSIRSAPRL